MFFTLNKRSLYKTAAAVFITTLFFSCQKELSIENGAVAVSPPDLTTKVSASVSGFVTDENDAPVLGATVQVGTSSISTDKFGFFEVKNVQVVKTAATVTVSQPGYFKGIKTWMGEQGKVAFFRIKLIPKTSVGTINSSTGGNVTLRNGLSITLPAGALVNAATNAAYTGAVNVAAYWINPMAADLSRIMPGDLRGLNADGALKLLRTFGMAAVELTGSGGELLQIATGKSATLSLPIPAALAADAPASIPLWYFDESNGLWREQGEATKSGNNYVGNVTHFSFWNYDTPANYVQFSCTIKDQSNNPVKGALLKITVVGTYNSGYGVTDSLGYVSGPVPDNAQLLLEVYSSVYCQSPIHTQAFTTSNVPVSLGTITILPANGIGRFTGTLVDCNNNPIASGYVMIYMNNDYDRLWVNNGVIDYARYLCTNTMNVTLIGIDPANNQQSGPYNFTLVSGNTSIGSLQACGTSSTEFINYTIDGTPHDLLSPPDSIYDNSPAGAITSYISGSQAGAFHYVNFSFDNTGMGVGTNQTLNSFYSTYLPNQAIISPAATVNITECGPVGQFISGNFTCAIVSTIPAATYNITCSFRVRRNN